MGYINGELTQLVPLDYERHFENVYVWANDTELTETLLFGDRPMTKTAEKEWFDSMSQANGCDIVFAIETLDGEHIGTSGIHQINHQHGTATTGSYIGMKSEWGKGYGTDAAIVRARYCFHVLGLRQLYSSVLEGNERSMKMQEKVGYVVYGVAPKKYWKRGMYRDETLTVLTRERFYDLHG